MNQMFGKGSGFSGRGLSLKSVESSGNNGKNIKLEIIWRCRAGQATEQAMVMK